jgi:hypothetical protein
VRLIRDAEIKCNGNNSMKVRKSKWKIKRDKWKVKMEK